MAKVWAIHVPAFIFQMTIDKHFEKLKDRRIGICALEDQLLRMERRDGRTTPQLQRLLGKIDDELTVIESELEYEQCLKAARKRSIDRDNKYSPLPKIRPIKMAFV